MLILKRIFFVTLLITLASCKLLAPSAPARFPQFKEHSIEGPGSYELPQWSSDSRYLAFIDRARQANLIVYDTNADTKWTVASDVFSAHFDWGPNNILTYLRYRPDLSGSPFPIIYDLYQVNLDGSNDKLIASNLSDVADFDWFSDGERIGILLTNPVSASNVHDAYILNTLTGTLDLLLKAQDIDLDELSSLALSQDEKTILFYGSRDLEAFAVEAQIVIYDLETQTVINRIIPSQIIPSGNITYPIPSILDRARSGWVGGQRWILGLANTPGGVCYNYALFFFDTTDLQNSFCVPTAGGIVAEPDISPDRKKISYMTIVGPGNVYVVISDLPSDLMNQLDTGVK